MLETLFKKFETIIILDTETTGVDAKNDEIIEIGALRLENGGGEEEMDSLIKLSAGRELPEFITGLTGITAERLGAEGEEKGAVCEKLAALLDAPSPLVVAYNAQFDLTFLYYFLRAGGAAEALKGAKFLDALTVYKDRRDYPHRLENAVAEYGLTTPNTHRALDDARAALAVLAAMEAEEDDLERYINVFGYNPKFGVSGSRIGSIKYVKQPYTRDKRAYERV